MKSSITLYIIAMAIGLNAQTVIVNPDGTHSLLIDNRSTKTLLNPNGTHSTIIDNGSTKILVNPYETHSIIIDNGTMKTIVDPYNAPSTVIRKTAFCQSDSIRGKQFSLTGKITKKIQLTPGCGFIAFGTVVEFEVIDITGMDYVNRSIGIIITCPEMYGAGFFKKGKKYQVVFSNENQTDIGWAIPNKHLLKTNHLTFEPYAITVKKLQ